MKRMNVVATVGVLFAVSLCSHANAGFRDYLDWTKQGWATYRASDKTFQDKVDLTAWLADCALALKQCIDGQQATYMPSLPGLDMVPTDSDFWIPGDQVTSSLELIDPAIKLDTSGIVGLDIIALSMEDAEFLPDDALSALTDASWEENGIPMYSGGPAFPILDTTELNSGTSYVLRLAVTDTINGVHYGAASLGTPAPGTLALLGMAGLTAVRRRRRE